MATRKINPTSPGQRGMTRADFSEITTDTPEKSLLKPLRKKGGRNNTGRILQDIKAAVTNKLTV